MNRPSSQAPLYLVIGAAGGIGREACRLLESAGARVALAGRDPARLAQVDAVAAGGRFALDATDADEVDRVVQSLTDDQGSVEGIVNCAGSLLLKPAHLTRPDEWRSTLETNLGSAFAVVRAAGRTMRSGGSVVLMASAAARVGLANHEAIAAAKAGVIGLTLSAAATYASRNLRFNAVAPGLVRTPLTERITRNETVAASSIAMHALGRLGEPADIARMIVWLLDPAQSWMTGQVLGVDGGLSTVRPRTI